MLRNYKNNDNELKENGNQLDNLYFASAIEREDRELNDSLDGDDIDGLAKVVKKGSFKIIKPKFISK